MQLSAFWPGEDDPFSSRSHGRKFPDNSGALIYSEYRSRHSSLETRTIAVCVCVFVFVVLAVGCADLPVISGARTVRDGDLAIVRCNHSRQVFHLKCNGNVWFGDLTNCTSGDVTLNCLCNFL